MIDSVKVGARIKEIRVAKNLTQMQLSKMIGIRSSFLSVVERGEKLPSLETLVKLANVLDVSTDYFLMNETKAGFSVQCGMLEEKMKQLAMEDAHVVANTIEFMICELQKKKKS